MVDRARGAALPGRLRVAVFSVVLLGTALHVATVRAGTLRLAGALVVVAGVVALALS